LHLDNEQALYYYWRETAAAAHKSAPEAKQAKLSIWTAQQAARFALADKLKDSFEREGEGVESVGVFGDLITAALGRVDWNAIAEALLEDCEENS
jgi:hypothetical protein